MQASTLWYGNAAKRGASGASSVLLCYLPAVSSLLPSPLKTRPPRARTHTYTAHMYIHAHTHTTTNIYHTSSCISTHRVLPWTRRPPLRYCGTCWTSTRRRPPPCSPSSGRCVNYCMLLFAEAVSRVLSHCMFAMLFFGGGGGGGKEKKKKKF